MWGRPVNDDMQYHASLKYFLQESIIPLPLCITCEVKHFVWLMAMV